MNGSNLLVPSSRACLHIGVTSAPWIAACVFILCVAPGSFDAATNEVSIAPAPTWGDVSYAKVGGQTLTLDVYLPAGAGPFPACILVHGGGFKSGNKRTSIYPLFAPLRDAGLVCFSIDYRLAPTNRWPAGLEDVDTAIRWMKGHTAEYKVDSRRIALIGDSSGGHYVSFVGARGRESVKAVVPVYAG